MKKRTTFSSDPVKRKQARLVKLFSYFHDALAEVSRVIEVGQQQHGTHGWDRSKSGDELEAMMRHTVDAGYLDSDDVSHSAKIAWRALANLQKELETEHGLPISVGSYDPRLPVATAEDDDERQADVLVDALAQSPMFSKVLPFNWGSK